MKKSSMDETSELTRLSQKENDHSDHLTEETEEVSTEVVTEEVLGLDRHSLKQKSRKGFLF